MIGQSPNNCSSGCLPVKILTYRSNRTSLECIYDAKKRALITKKDAYRISICAADGRGPGRTPATLVFTIPLISSADDKLVHFSFSFFPENRI